MNEYKITYFRHPEPNITVMIKAKSEDDAIRFAKEYRMESFSIDLQSDREQEKAWSRA